MEKLSFVKKKLELMQEFGDVAKYREATEQLKKYKSLNAAQIKLEAKKRKELAKEELRLKEIEELRAQTRAQANLKAKRYVFHVKIHIFFQYIFFPHQNSHLIQNSHFFLFKPNIFVQNSHFLKIRLILKIHIFLLKIRIFIKFIFFQNSHLIQISHLIQDSFVKQNSHLIQNFPCNAKFIFRFKIHIFLLNSHFGSKFTYFNFKFTCFF